MTYTFHSIALFQRQQKCISFCAAKVEMSFSSIANISRLIRVNRFFCHSEIYAIFPSASYTQVHRRQHSGLFCLPILCPLLPLHLHAQFIDTMGDQADGQTDRNVDTYSHMRRHSHTLKITFQQWCLA